VGLCLNFFLSGDGQWVLGAKEWDSALKFYIQKYPEDWELVQKLVGLSRQVSRHASAFVFANKPIPNFIPTTSVGGVRVTQYTANSVELSGGLKNDLLVLTSLVDINDAIKMIQSKFSNLSDYVMINGINTPKVRVLPHQGKLLDIWNLPEDQDVFRMIAEGDTETVFQFCTSGATKWLKYFNHLKPNGNKLIDSIESMAIFTALDRPGPLDAYVEDDSGNKHNMLVEYTRRAMGKPPIGEIPIFSEIIPETYGIPIMQESVQKIYYLLTGCTKAEAEEFRSDIAKKKKSKIEKAYPFFMEKVSKKVGIEQAQKAWNNLETFSQYGFCRAHAISYAIVAYACAFLKYHYPLEWWCAVLRNATKEEIADQFWKHCKQYICLPDIQKSEINFEIKEGKIQAPLSLLDRVGETAHKNLIQHRPYFSIDDFCQKIVSHKLTRSLTSRVVHNLIIIGALDSLFLKDNKVLSIFEKLKLYEDTLQNLTKTKNKDLVQYSKLNALNVYQLKKTILPIYSENIIDIVSAMRLDDLSIFIDSHDKVFYEKTRNKKQEKARFISIKDFEALEKNEVTLDEGVYPIKIGLIGYVQSYRVFKYPKPLYEKQAIELIVDVEGVQKKFLKWNVILKENEKDLTGAIVGVILYKMSESKEFVLNEIITIESPFILGT
jgi:DNA polymerase III alpha subunit